VNTWYINENSLLSMCSNPYEGEKELDLDIKGRDRKRKR
jgi:hypothetical protein